MDEKRVRADAAPRELKWTKEFPLVKGDDSLFYWVRRAGVRDIVAEFCMGRMWFNGVAYTKEEINEHEFLGPITPAPREQELKELLEENARLKQHIADLNHDLAGTIEDCNKHHGEGNHA